MADRKAGRYTLTGAVYRDNAGKVHHAGDEVDLNEKDANRLAKAFRPVGAPSHEQTAAVHQAEKAVDRAEKKVEEAHVQTAPPSRPSK